MTRYEIEATGGRDALDANDWTADFRIDGRPARLTIEFASDRERVVCVSITAEGGMTPTELARFPWATWIRAAGHGVRSRRWTEDLDGLLGDMLSERAALKEIEVGPVDGPKRPGRRGRPAAHYLEAFAAYEQVKASGTSTPMKDLTALYDKQGDKHNLETVRTWVKKGKKLKEEQA